MADGKNQPPSRYKKIYTPITNFISWKRKPNYVMPDNHIFYSQLIEYFWHLTKSICLYFLELIIFLTVLIDGLLGLATIIYIINGNYIFAGLCWLGISFLAFQFIQVLEKRNTAKFTHLDIIKILFAIFLGAIAGAVIWPAFDKDFGYAVGIAFGALFGITIKLIINIISFELRQNKL
ncbi:MAG: hypothetical protein FD167_3948 [bacterium]|nr:MAG: hypothetical protein FD167_3948 [bacterium]